MAHRTKSVSLIVTLTSTMVCASAEDILTSRAHTKFTTKNTRLTKRKRRYSGSLAVRERERADTFIISTENATQVNRDQVSAASHLYLRSSGEYFDFALKTTCKKKTSHFTMQI